MPLTIVRNDITKMKVDAIVNAANTSLQAGGGVCGAIFSAAGAERLQKACNKLSPIQIGEAVLTKGFNLLAKYIIHAAGPVYRDGKQGEEALLQSCYDNALNLAAKHRCESIAFPLISSGIFGYPKEEALSVATKTIGDWLARHEDDMEVSLVVFDKAAFAVAGELLGHVRAYIDERYVDDRVDRCHRSLRYSDFPFDDRPENASLQQTASLPTLPFQLSEEASEAAAKAFPPSVVFDDFAKQLDEPFSATLLRIIDAKGKTDVEVYKRANLDRKLFSKIRSGKGYMPSKKTVIALAVSLELTADETHDLLKRAGYALSRSVLFDVIVEYFITHRKYDIYEINNVLFAHDQALLGG